MTSQRFSNCFKHYCAGFEIKEFPAGSRPGNSMDLFTDALRSLDLGENDSGAKMRVKITSAQNVSSNPTVKQDLTNYRYIIDKVSKKYGNYFKKSIVLLFFGFPRSVLMELVSQGLRSSSKVILRTYQSFSLGKALLQHEKRLKSLPVTIPIRLILSFGCFSF
jgi:hypothetical protein